MSKKIFVLTIISKVHLEANYPNDCTAFSGIRGAVKFLELKQGYLKRSKYLCSLKYHSTRDRLLRRQERFIWRGVILNRTTFIWILVRDMMKFSPLSSNKQIWIEHTPTIQFVVLMASFMLLALLLIMLCMATASSMTRRKISGKK